MNPINFWKHRFKFDRKENLISVRYCNKKTIKVISSVARAINSVNDRMKSEIKRT